ncbi:permease YjgP/YjgQ family protein [Desulfonatronospira thiodismutans ASO3-1]|uniref:Permease YjgP/YjgQ family protein n=1 Tax=Desulfonatronospira thiodismutans ASO3-1 TaxID=555779 RepID=D6SQ22_9BACT|nr:LptF/LptG family permease [Desulfonatronospira thiodismutans]EFI34848.1 permease YjgP/YjgQ family protein [Desulfonatronospira thiodismutans ASO3-1]
MSVLNRYLLRQNLFYTAVLLFSGTMVYLIVDFVGRMNAMVEAGLGALQVLEYFVFKMPLIVAQTLPAIFMLGVLIQMAMMHRSNELVAMESSAISFRKPAVFFIGYALVVFMLLFVFSETLGVRGEQVTRQIWNQDVRDREAAVEGLEDVWVKDRDYMIHIERAHINEGRGKDFTAYKKSDPGKIQEIIKAPEFEVHKNRLLLRDVTVFKPHSLERQSLQEMEMEVKIDLRSFALVDSDLPYQAWSIFTLSALVNQLKESGASVEKISTALHSKIAYPFALVVMTLLALALFTRIKNIYALVTLGLVIVFFYYTVYVFGVSYAEEGVTAPFVGAWTANVFFGILSLLQLFWMDRR